LAALRLCPGDPDVLRNIGKAAWMLGQDKVAFVAYGQAIRSAPDDATAYVSLAQMYLDVDLPWAAISVARRGLARKTGCRKRLLEAIKRAKRHGAN